MADHTPIEWTDSTWNPIGGCSLASPGCTHCYAQRMAGTRLASHPLYAGTTQATKTGPVFNGHLTRAPDDHPVWTWPLRWRGAKHPKLGAGKPSMIFVGDMSDLFHEDRPDADIDRVFAVMELAPQHIFQVLTKRAERMRKYLSAYGVGGRLTKAAFAFGRSLPATGGEADDRNWLYYPARLKWPLPNVLAGVSVEDQTRADERIPHLLATPAAKRFISAEPLLGPIRLRNLYPITDDEDGVFIEGVHGNTPRIDWVICGGESGPNARPAHPNWAGSLRDQCASAGVPFFFKQWGTYQPFSTSCLSVGGSGPFTPSVAWPNGLIGAGNAETCGGPGISLGRVGKKAAGRLLDGRTHDEFPA